MLEEQQTETGDFTIKLLDLNPNLSSSPYPDGYPTTWTKFEIVISGLPNGTIPQKHRIGFRYYVKNGGPVALYLMRSELMTLILSASKK